jgi:hypothetical protein
MTRPVRKYIRSRTYLDFDLRMLQLSEYGHTLCARILFYESNGEIKSPSFRKSIQRYFLGAKPGAYKHKTNIGLCTFRNRFETSCIFYGDLGRYVVVLGDPHRVDGNKSGTTMVFFVGISKKGTWERIGAGEIGVNFTLLANNVEKIHLHLSGSNEPVMTACTGC